MNNQKQFWRAGGEDPKAETDPKLLFDKAITQYRELGGRAPWRNSTRRFGGKDGSGAGGRVYLRDCKGYRDAHFVADFHQAASRVFNRYPQWAELFEFYFIEQIGSVDARRLLRIKTGTFYVWIQRIRLEVGKELIRIGLMDGSPSVRILQG